MRVRGTGFLAPPGCAGALRDCSAPVDEFDVDDYKRRCAYRYRYCGPSCGRDALDSEEGEGGALGPSRTCWDCGALLGGIGAG